MPTDTLPPLASPAPRFAAGAIAFSLAAFGLLKLGWVETHVVLPLTLAQGQVAAIAFGAPALPIEVTLACSGADAVALCVGAIGAYPSPWRLRAGGAAGGLALILFLNSIRIGTLGRAAADPLLFNALHLYVWPALLILLIAGYVFGWMHVANRRISLAAPEVRRLNPLTPSGWFALWAVIFVVVFVAVSPLYLRSHVVAMAGVFIARCGAGALRVLGVDAATTGAILWTPRGGFEVTQECLSTPLIPLYGAAVMAYARNWQWRVAGITAAVPLFVALGVARLMVVALPAALIGSPLFLVHAFYQILLAGLLVCVVAAWRRGHHAWRIGAAACLVGGACGYLLASVYAGGLSALSIDIPFNDAQGAMASLPSFQSGLFVALSMAALPPARWRVAAAGVGALVAVQAATFGLLHLLARYSDLVPHIRDVRAWAIVAPLAIVMIGLVARERARI